MSDMTISLAGNVTGDLVLKPTKNGTPRLQFRLAVNRRRRTEAGQWEDWRTLYITVVCWRDLAENVAECVRKGDPVFVRGDLVSRTYVKEEVSRMVYEIEADSVSHDYSRGASVGFTRRRRGSVGPVEVDADGLPAVAPFDDEVDQDDLTVPEDLADDELAYVVVDEYATSAGASGRVLAGTAAGKG